MEEKVVAAQAPQVELIIRLRQDGNVELVGPLNNKLVCYGLLEMARESIQKHVIEQRLVQPVVGSLPRFPANGRG